MEFTKILETHLDIGRTILTLGNMTVDNIQRFGSIGHGLDGAWEEPARAVHAEAMLTCQSWKSHPEATTTA